MQSKQKNVAGLARAIKAVLGLALLTTVAGCVGYAGGGYVEGGYGGEVGAPIPVPPPPDVFLFGGGFDHDRGHDYHRYADRGHESRHEARDRWHRR